MRVGVLSTINNPTLPFILSALYQHGVDDLAVLLDEKIETEKDLRIWRERTGGAFENIAGASLHAFLQTSPFHFVGSHNGERCLNLIARLGLGCLVNAGTPRKLSGAVLAAVPHGVVNVHPGVLPAYRGCSCVEWAIYNDDKVGNTAHFMTAGYDEGPVIMSEWYEFPKDSDYQSIRVRTYRDGFVLMGKAVAMVSQKQMKPSDGIVQAEGKYWQPIPDDKMQVVMQRIQAQQYRYACL